MSLLAIVISIISLLLGTMTILVAKTSSWHLKAADNFRTKPYAEAKRFQDNPPRYVKIVNAIFGIQ